MRDKIQLATIAQAFIALATAFLVMGAVTRFFAHQQKQWISFGNNGGKSLVRTASIDMLVKQEKELPPTADGKPVKEYQVVVVCGGVISAEPYPAPDLRDTRFREIQTILRTLD